MGGRRKAQGYITGMLSGMKALETGQSESPTANQSTVTPAAFTTGPHFARSA
jgi:hypothetical protein